MCFALDMRYTRDMLPYGHENGIYIISRLPQGKHIEFYVVKYIELRSNISQNHSQKLNTLSFDIVKKLCRISTQLLNYHPLEYDY